MTELCYKAGRKHQNADTLSSGVRPSAEARSAVTGQCLLDTWEQLQIKWGVLAPLTCRRQRGLAGGVPGEDQRQVWMEYHQALGNARGRRMVLCPEVEFLPAWDAVCSGEMATEVLGVPGQELRDG